MSNELLSNYIFTTQSYFESNAKLQLCLEMWKINWNNKLQRNMLYLRKTNKKHWQWKQLFNILLRYYFFFKVSIAKINEI